MAMSSKYVLFALVASVLASGTGLCAASASDKVHLRFASFDPLSEALALPAGLSASAESRSWIVQFDAVPTEDGRRAIARLGARVYGYLPDHAHLVRMDAALRGEVAALPGVRSVTPYHPAYRVEVALLALLAQADAQFGPLAQSTHSARYNVLVVDRARDKEALIARIQGLGALVVEPRVKSRALVAELTPAQLARLLHFDEVLWVDRQREIGFDMDNARVQGGAQAIEVKAGFTGKGVRGHSFEGLEVVHADFDTPPLHVGTTPGISAHGQCVAGIIFGNGKSDPKARGLAPAATAFFTNYEPRLDSRTGIVDSLVRAHEVMFTSASWGHGLTSTYDSQAAELDEIVFDYDIPWTQAFGNTSARSGRAEAWAKNVLTVGSVTHGDNSSANDDSWFAGVGAMGPASDGRIKPDLVAYDDAIFCSDLTGAAGFDTSKSTYANFGGTSGATAIVAGHNALAIEMFTDGLFGPKRVPNGSRFANRPHASTLKALQIANAAPYAFTATSQDNRREHCGWGFPSLDAMYERRAKHFVVDETDLLLQGDSMVYRIDVASGQTELRVSLVYTDVAANPSATRSRVNDLSLRIKSPKGLEYWGNAGLLAGNTSTTGGTRDLVDPVENVFLVNPEAGTWEVEVGAYLVAEDGHVETQEVDADFGLVVVGGTLVSKAKGAVPVGAITLFGAGCPTGSGCSDKIDRNWTQTSTQATTTTTRVAILDWTTTNTLICGIDLYMGARGAAVDVPVHLYSLDIANATPLRSVASQTVRVAGLGTYSFDFPVQVEFSVSDLFFVVIDRCDQLLLPVSTTGEERLHHDWNGTAWGNAIFSTKWAYRLRGVLGKEVPTLRATGEPLIGKAMKLHVTAPEAARAAVLVFGASNQSWGALQLPLVYSVPCSVLVSGDILAPFAIDATRRFEASLQLPSDPRLLNLVVYLQAWIQEPSNAVGWIVSNGLRIKVGQ